MAKKSKMSDKGATRQQRPIEVFASMLSVLEPEDREEEIALYIEELERSAEEPDPARRIAQARNKANQILMARGFDPVEVPQPPAEPVAETDSSFNRMSNAAAAAVSGQTADFSDEGFDDFGWEKPTLHPADKKGAAGKSFIGGLSQQQLIRYAVAGVAALAVVGVIAAVALKIFSGGQGEENDQLSVGENLNPQSGSTSGQDADDESALTPAGNQEITGVTLQLSNGTYTISSGENFGVETADEAAVTQNTTEEGVWMLTVEQGGGTVTVPAWVEEITLTVDKADVTTGPLEAQTMNLSASQSTLATTGLSAGQLNLQGAQSTVEVQADEVRESVSVDLEKGSLHLTMPIPEDYGYTVTSSSSMVRLGSSPYITSEETVNTEAPFQYSVNCEMGTVEIDLATDGVAENERDGEASPQGETDDSDGTGENENGEG